MKNTKLTRTQTYTRQVKSDRRAAALDRQAENNVVAYNALDDLLDEIRN